MTTRVDFYVGDRRVGSEHFGGDVARQAAWVAERVAPIFERIVIACVESPCGRERIAFGDYLGGGGVLS